MRYEVRLSPDGRRVAIRDLQDVVRVAKDSFQWSDSDGDWLTDEQVAEWIPLATQRDHVTVARAPDNSCWVVEHNGVHAVAVAAADPGLAAAVALTCVQRAGGTALVTVEGGSREFAGRYHKKHRLIPLNPGNEG